MATKTRKLGIAPTLVVLILVLGLAMFVGVILLMMLVQPGIAHSPDQATVGDELPLAVLRQAAWVLLSGVRYR